MPVFKAIGINPKLATKAVIKTGRNRVEAPSIMALFSCPFSSHNLRIKVSRTKPFNTAIPDSAINPTPAEIDSGMSRIHRAKIPPVNAKGTPVKITIPSLTVPNTINSNPKITISVAGTTKLNLAEADSNCSKVPP